MSHKFRKPLPISQARRDAARANGAKSQGPVTAEGKAKSALNAVTHGLTASAIVLTTESKEKYAALLAAYLEKCDPDGPIETDLVEEIVAAKWQQRRVAAMIAALLDVEMDCMDKEIREQFEHIDNTVRTALAFKNQAKDSPTLALLKRYAARHAREYHRALKHLREIQSERRDPNEKSQNEPKPDLTPDAAPTSDDETGHRRLATDHCSSETDDRPLATDHCSSETGHRPPATDDCSSELATSHEPLATEVSPLAVDPIP
jgi:hypothetical protein